MAATTQVTIDRATAEVTLGALRAWKTIATEFPELFRQGDTLNIGAAEVLMVAALDRISYVESKPANVKETIRGKLAAHLAFPNVGVRGW